MLNTMMKNEILTLMNKNLTSMIHFLTLTPILIHFQSTNCSFVWDSYFVAKDPSTPHPSLWLASLLEGMWDHGAMAPLRQTDYICCHVDNNQIVAEGKVCAQICLDSASFCSQAVEVKDQSQDDSQEAIS